MNTEKNTVLLSIGSNLGNRLENIEGCISRLSDIEGTVVLSQSSIIETEPVGPEQPKYLNCAVLVETSLPPDKLLGQTAAIELAFGRTRNLHWGPRTLDIDIILFGMRIVSTPALKIPHPHFRERMFVLAPAIEVAPELVDPVTGETLSHIHKALCAAQAEGSSK